MGTTGNNLAFFVAALLSACSQPTKITGPTSAALTVKGPDASGGMSAFQLAALGDSITLAFDITELYQADTSYSWATGSALPGSLLERLQATPLATEYSAISAMNLAQIGATASGTAPADLSAQVAAALAGNPDLVTIEIGANDVCSGDLSSATLGSDFGAALAGALGSLLGAKNGPKAIILASIPNINELTSLGLPASCSTAWNLLCPNLAVPGFSQSLAQLNQAIAASVAADTSGRVVGDGGAVGALSLSASDISSVDCFHPSEAGQALLAATVWNATQVKLPPLLNP